MPGEVRLSVLLLSSFLMVYILLGADAHQIPRQVIFTGKPRRLRDMPHEIQFNVRQTAGTSNSTNNKSPKLRPRWLGDDTCHHYIKEHYDEELLKFFDTASPGCYRGDICRAAVLYREGGFYADVDVQMAVPLEDIVDGNTTFTSVHSINGDIFNGLLAVVPKSEIMAETLHEIRKWHRNAAERTGLLGTMTLHRALSNVMKASCPSVSLADKERKELQWTCGKHTIRLYQEGDLLCFMKEGQPQPFECPIERKKGDMRMRYGFFIPGHRVNIHRPIIGWPRLLACQDAAHGCGSGGHTEFAQETEVQIEPSGVAKKRPSLVRHHSVAS